MLFGGFFLGIVGTLPPPWQHQSGNEARLLRSGGLFRAEPGRGSAELSSEDAGINHTVARFTFPIQLLTLSTGHPSP